MYLPKFLDLQIFRRVLKSHEQRRFHMRNESSDDTELVLISETPNEAKFLEDMSWAFPRWKRHNIDNAVDLASLGIDNFETFSKQTLADGNIRIWLTRINR